ncbi:MAG TPA: dockerin type I domain-containing protein, partial [candidate division Zixibacteria bacterium]|nr:dockerin type I domain-containing protein [candidate division Zixibacteria bacterium]
AFLDLINTRFTSVSFNITLESLPGTTASPSSGTIAPQSVQSVLILTDRSNVPVGEYTGNIRVIYLPDDTIIVPLHYFVADTIFGIDFTPPADSVVQPGSVVNFGHQVFFTLWSKNTAAVNWHVENQAGVRISRNFNASLTSKGVWEWVPQDTVTIPNGTPTVTSISSMTPTGNPITDDYFSVVYQTSGGPPATTRGDLNNDGFLTPSDVVLQLNLVFLGQTPPAGAAEGDVNCDGQLTPADVVLLMNNVFLDSGSLCA